MALPIFQRTVVTDNGDIIPNAQVEVRIESSGALATLYSDRAGTVSLSNPFAADGTGLALFYANPDEYKITATGLGGSVQWRYVVVIDTNDIAIVQDNLPIINSVANNIGDIQQAEENAAIATAQALDASNSASNAYTYAQSAASAVAYQDLTAIAQTKAETAVDVFVYDTSKDSDGGAWRKRCQHTSWYNETLNTTTRGSRKEFPAVAVIVAETDKVTIYDGDDPSLPMWMVFNCSLANGYHLRSALLSASFMANGVMAVTGVSDGLFIINFPKDSASFKTSSGYGWAAPEIVNRNVANSFITDGSAGIVNSSVNDVAMTVLPNAPIDPATGLPICTIAVASDGNSTYSVSIITDSGSVYDVASDSTGEAVSIDISKDGGLTVVRSDGTVYVWNDIGSINTDGVSPDITYTTANTLGTASLVEVA